MKTAKEEKPKCESCGVELVNFEVEHNAITCTACAAGYGQEFKGVK
jgi:hypothetical protein